MTLDPPQLHDRPEAGTHLIADFWDVRPIESVDALERAIRAAVEAAGATLLNVAFHQFPGLEGDVGGITGYALLAESHISVHTWPERDYVAIDIFMCGAQRPTDSLEVLRRTFHPGREDVQVVRRGVRDAADPQTDDCSSISSMASGSGAINTTAQPTGTA